MKCVEDTDSLHVVSTTCWAWCEVLEVVLLLLLFVLEIAVLALLDLISICLSNHLTI